MNKTNKFSSEMREGDVRMVQEHRGEYRALGAAVESIAPKIGCALRENAPLMLLRRKSGI